MGTFHDGDRFPVNPRYHYLLLFPGKKNSSRFLEILRKIIPEVARATGNAAVFSICCYHTVAFIIAIAWSGIQ
jgi:hypothetical protein